MPERMLKLSLRFLVVAIQISFICSAADQNRIKSLNVKCGDSDMLVDIEFNQPFNGIIFSKGYFARNECVHVKARPSKYSYQFTIAYAGCGTTAGGSGVSSTGARRSDGFLRSADDVPDAGNVTRTRRDITNSSAVPGPLGRSMGGWGVPSMGGPEPMGDPYAANMQNQDYSGGGLQLGGGMTGDPYAGGQNMGGMMGGGGQQYGGGQQPGPGNGGGSYPQQQMGGNGGGAWGGQQQQMGGSGGGGQWNGQQGGGQQQQVNGGASFSQDQNRGQNVNVVSSASSSSNSQAGTSSNFASSFPGGSSGSGDDQASSQGQSVDDSDNTSGGSSVSLPKTNKPFGEDQTGGSSRFFENIIIIQYDANIQEVWDVAKALRCEWHDNYHKTVSYKPFQVDSLEVVPATFAGDNVGVWMTVQQGKGPYAPEVNGIVRIGEYLTLAIGIQDETKKFDMRVVNCFASDGARPAIQLVDEYGCVTRPKIMSDLAKVTNYGDQASVVTYAYFQAFKFPDSVDVHLECSVEICKQGCSKQCYNKMIGESSSSSGRAAAGTAVASISTGMHMGAAKSRGKQMSRKVDSASDSADASNLSDSSDMSLDSSNDTQSSSASAAGKNAAVLSGARAASVSSSKDSNMDSVSSKIQNSLNGGKMVVKIATKAPSVTSAGAALYKAMGSDDDEVDATTVATTTTTKQTKGSSKRSLRTKKVPSGSDDEDTAYRRRRDVNSDLQQNVGIKRTIRVVAPGDLSFLDTNRNNTVVYAGAQNVIGQNDVCIAPSSFVAGIVVLLALLILTTLTAMILCLRLRKLDRVSNKLKDMDMDYMKHTM